MYNRVAFGCKLSKHFLANVPDLTKREFTMLGTLVAFTVLFGIYPAPILDGIHYSVSTLIYNSSELDCLDSSSMALLSTIPVLFLCKT